MSVVESVDTKNWNCNGCGIPLDVEKSYEPEWCCTGFECGCFGLPVNPVFCEDCLDELYGR